MMIKADGFIYLVDRKKDVIITGGENIYPVQIEDFLRGCDAINQSTKSRYQIMQERYHKALQWEIEHSRN